MHQPIAILEAIAFALGAIAMALLGSTKQPALLEQRRFLWLGSGLALLEAATRASAAFDLPEHPSLRTQIFSTPGFLLAAFIVVILIRQKYIQRRKSGSLR